MSDDDVVKLRQEASRDIPDDMPNDTIGWLKYAADEIERLRAELAAMREALRDVRICTGGAMGERIDALVKGGGDE